MVVVRLPTNPIDVIETKTTRPDEHVTPPHAEQGV